MARWAYFRYDGESYRFDAEAAERVETQLNSALMSGGQLVTMELGRDLVTVPIAPGIPWAIHRPRPDGNDVADGE